MTSGKAPPTIFWDFDGTLARSPGWSATMLKAVNENYPDHAITREQIWTQLHDGFPWHNPEKPHPELCNPEAWWEYLESLLAEVCRKIGLGKKESEIMARRAHELITSPEWYTLFEDAIPALERLSRLGYRHIILTNNFPELTDIINSLPLNIHISECVNSADIGYEKPHDRAFAIALERAGHPEKVWMVGDNINADVRGAEAAGIPAILVHRPTDERVKYYADNLLEAAAIIERGG